MSTSIAARSDSEPALIGAPPPAVTRDRMVLSWVGVATISSFGDAVFRIALAWTAVHLLAPTLAGLVIGIETLPQAALMLAGGVIADLRDTRYVIVAGEISRAVVLVAASITWQLGLHSASVLVTVALGFGVAAGLSNPARSTLARQLVRTEDLVAVSGWLQVGSRLARLAGAPVGALIVAAGGLGPAMLIDAGSFALVAGALVTMIRPRYVMPRAAGEPWLATLRDGLGYVARTPAVRWLLLGLSCLNVFIAPVIGIGVALRVTRSSWGPSWVGLAEASLAVGAIVGSIGAIRWRSGHLAARGFWLLVVQGASLAVIGIPARATLLAAMFVVGVTAGTASVWISAVFQQTIAAGHLGRVSAVSQLGDLVFTPLTLPLFGVLVATTSVLTATISCGLAMSALCLLFAVHPEIRRLP